MFTAEETARVGKRPLPLLFPILLLGVAFGVGFFSQSLWGGYSRGESSAQIPWLYSGGFEPHFHWTRSAVGAETLSDTASLWIFVYRDGRLRTGSLYPGSPEARDRSVRIGSTVSQEELTAHTKLAVQKYPETVVAVAAEWGTPSGEVNDAIDALRAGGVRRIVLATR